MVAFLRWCFLVSTLLFSSSVFSQNILITYQKSDGLFVCGTDTFFVQVKNTSLLPIVGATLTVTLPTGMSYQPGSMLGVVEQNLANLAAPVFGLPILAPDATVSATLLLTADCAAAAALDAGQLFVANLEVQSVQGSVQISTLPFSIETGLLLIDSIDNTLLSGERYDTLFRKIWVRNTRLGKIGGLHFEDQHQPGFDAALPGANFQANGPSFFEGDFSGSWFTAFGDGDTWLEMGETACFTERIIITDCGIPAFTNSSVLRVGWGCGDQVCRYDSLIVGTVIQPSTKTPDLEFSNFWTPSVDQCGELPSTLRVKIKNNGRAAAENILFSLYALNPLAYGFAPASFRLVSHGITTPLPPNAVTAATLPSCAKEFASDVSLVIPTVPALDSLDLLFDVYYCVEECTQTLGTFTANYFYRKICPTNGFVSDTLLIRADPRYLVNGSVSLNVGTCLRDGQTYSLGYVARSRRLVENTGFLNVVFTLPWGLSLDDNCPILLGGVPPTSGSVNAIPGQPTTVALSFQLPLPADSLFMPLCLRYDCQDSMACTGNDDFILPESGGEFTIAVDPIGFCGGDPCRLPMRQQTYWSRTLNAPPDCGIGGCQDFQVAVERCTPGPGGGGMSNALCCDSLGGTPGSEFTWDFKTYRLNLGIADADNDRRADSIGLPGGSNLRRDRYLPGDTLRVEYQGYVALGGGYQNFGRVIWNEIVKSDMGVPTNNDVFVTQTGQHAFLNADSFQHVRDLIRIRYANGTEVNCEIDDKTYQSDQHFFRLHLINTIPPAVLDQVASQRHIFKAKLNELYASGCLPKPTLDMGDSIFFYTDFRIRPNFYPLSNNFPKPPLVGFRTAVAMTDRPFAWNEVAFRKSQYSGYRIRNANNLIAIRSCESSATVQPYRFGIHLARENMFPYEVRPLAYILDYKQTFPAGLQVESVRLLYLALQDSLPQLDQLPLEFAVFDTLVSVNFDPAFADPVDEGFVLGATVKFQADCHFETPDSSTQYVTYQYAPGLHEPSISTSVYGNILGFYANQPSLVFSSADTIVNMPTSEFGVNFTLQNVFVTPAPNVWVAAVSPSGQALDFELLQASPPAQTLPGTQGVFQLATINGFSQRDFRLQGRNAACDQDFILLIFGWGCAPFTDLGQASCHRDTFVVQLRVQSPELELDIKQQPPSIQLCTESDYFELEIYNAKVGYAFDPYATVKLPAGLSLVPGSCAVAYPVGTAYQPIADPQLLSGNFYQWALDSLHPALAANGLPGVDLYPQNALRIRFRTLAECGFVANAQPFFGTSGQSACGREINVLNKPGNALQITGLNAGYGVAMSLQGVDNQNVYCGGMQKFQLSMSLGGTPSASDSVYVALPLGATLVPGSYLPQQNAVDGTPTVFPGGFRVPLPTNAQAGTIVKFQFSLTYDQTAGCTDQHLLAQARIRSEAFCALTGDSCTVYVATGEAIANIALARPELTLSNITLQLSNTGQINATITINNVGTVPAASGVYAQIWQDADVSGTLSAGDSLLQTIATVQTLLPGAALPLSGVLTFQLADRCHLLVVLPAVGNCACTERVLLVPSTVLQHPTIQSCIIQPIRLGIMAQAGSTYQWLAPVAVLCDTCATTTFYPPDDVLPGQPQIFVLEERRGDCTLLHRFEVIFGAAVSIALPGAVLCSGQMATLATVPGAGAGATYQWFGPDLTNPTHYQQIVQPKLTSQYNVVVTFPGGCTATASATVTVLPVDSLLLPPVTTCPSRPVMVLNQMTETPGMYTLHIPQANGCDSIIYQELFLLPKIETTETRTFCTGDALPVFDTLLTQDGQVCRTFKATNGCDSTHCITATKLPVPEVAIPDTLFGEASQPIDINGPKGYLQYVWVPNVTGCDNCATLQVQQDSGGLYLYLLAVTDANGCSATVEYRVLVFPPCGPDNVLIPNAFTPNDDGVNDVFETVGERSEVITRLTIYDRWGEKVCDHQGDVFWDGTIDGKPAPSDVYVYIIEIACGAKEGKRVGEVTLLR